MQANEEDTEALSPDYQVVKRRWCFKTVILGDSGVGKTWLVETVLVADSEVEDAAEQPTSGHFYQQQQRLAGRGEGDASDETGTIGVTFNLAKLELNGSTVLLQVWDTSGKYRYRGLLENYMTDISCIIIAYNPCSQSAEECSQSLATWHQFALESRSPKSVSPAAAPVMFCVAAIGGGCCPRPQACDHMRCLASGRAFAETLRGRFFYCRRLEGTAKCQWLDGEELTAQWLGRELLRRHFDHTTRLQEAEEAAAGDSRKAAQRKETRSCCQRLTRRLQELAWLGLWPATAVFLLSRRLMSRA